MFTPTVAVIVPAYNVGPWIMDCVESVLGQSYPHVELIVVDDGSTDDTVDRLSKVSDPRMTLLRQTNAGVSAARNLGAAQSSADVICFLDGDDLWSPNKIERSLSALERFEIVGSRMQYVNESGAGLPASAGESPHGPDGTSKMRDARLMPFPLSSILFSRRVVREVGLFDVELRQSQDIEFFARAADLAQVGWVDEILGGYRLRRSSTSSAQKERQTLMWQFIVARIAARRDGRDLSLGTFTATYRPDPRDRRRYAAASRYRNGGLKLAHRNPSGIIDLAVASAIAPRYVLKRLRRHIAG